MFNLEGTLKDEIVIEIFEEEIKSLLCGKSVEAYKNPKIILSGKKTKVGENKLDLITEILKSTDFEFNNMTDILYRYNNEEYWDPELPTN